MNLLVLAQANVPATVPAQRQSSFLPRQPMLLRPLPNEFQALDNPERAQAIGALSPYG